MNPKNEDVSSFQSHSQVCLTYTKKASKQLFHKNIILEHFSGVDKNHVVGFTEKFFYTNYFVGLLTKAECGTNFSVLLQPSRSECCSTNRTRKVIFFFFSPTYQMRDVGIAIEDKDDITNAVVPLLWSDNDFGTITQIFISISETGFQLHILLMDFLINIHEQ